MALEIETLVEKAIAARAALFDARHETAFRLFNGFSEGCPQLAIDLYASTLVVHDYDDAPAAGKSSVANAALALLRKRLPWLRAAILKTRNSPATDERRGVLAFGTDPDREVCEHGVRYAIDLQMNRDASLYLDTRNLRAWALANLRGRSLLNTFAYTGSIGVAARAGGAAEVVHLDRNGQFLRLAEASCALNGIATSEHEFRVGDFFREVSRFKRIGKRFDCVVVDPPFFASSAQATVDLASDSARLINKVRPLISDGGHLVAVNNALFVSGRDFMATLEKLCADGYLAIAELIPVPEDFTGYAETRCGEPVTDPTPFNHSTKIAVLSVRRKHP